MTFCDQCGLGRENSLINPDTNRKSSTRVNPNNIPLAPVLRQEGLKTHLLEDCKGISSCDYCPAKYRKGIKLPEKDFAHCCEDYLARLMEEIVGPKVFQAAREALNRRLTNRDRLLTEDPKRLVSKKDGFVERLMGTELEAHEKRIVTEVNKLKESTDFIKVT